MERAGSVPHIAAPRGDLAPSLRSLSDTFHGNSGSSLGGKYAFKSKVELYKGSVSTVFKCMLVGGTAVVVKTYHKSKMVEKHFHKLEREVDAMKALGRSGSVGIVTLLDTYEDASAIYLVMECCEGGDLFKRLMLHGGRLPEAWVASEVVAPLLGVLERMHCLRLMHRDIKPENIFITAEGEVKLGDFGLAIDWARELAFSRSGTLDYMAPEVLMNPATHTQESTAVTASQLAAKGIRPYSAAVDVWAVGCLAYELVSGRPPFEVEDEKQTASNIIYSNVIRFDPTASSAWADFVTQALIKDPRRRPDAATLLGHPWIAAYRSRNGGSTTKRCSTTPLSTAAEVPAPAATAAAAVPSTGGSSSTSSSGSACGSGSGGSAVSSSSIGSSSFSLAASNASSSSSSNGGGGGGSGGGNGIGSQQSQPRTSTPSANAPFKVAATVLASPAPVATLTQVRPATPAAITPPPAATTASSIPPAAVSVTSASYTYGMSASVPPQQRAAAAAAVAAAAAAVAAAQTPGGPVSSLRTASGNNGYGSNGALRSLLDAFKTASLSGSNNHAAANGHFPNSGGHAVSNDNAAANAAGTGGGGIAAFAPNNTPATPRATWSQWQQQTTSNSCSSATAASSGGGSSVVAVVGWRSPPVSPMRDRCHEGSQQQQQQQQPLLKAPSGRGPPLVSPPQQWTSATPSGGSGGSAQVTTGAPGMGGASPQRMGHRVSSTGLLSSIMRPIAGLSSTNGNANTNGNTSGNVSAQQGSKPPRPRSGSPGNRLVSASAAAAAASTMTSSGPSSPLRRSLLSGPSPPRQHVQPSPSPPRQQPPPSPSPPRNGWMHLPSSAAASSAGAATPPVSAAIMHDLARNWGAVVSVSVNADRKLPQYPQQQQQQQPVGPSIGLIPTGRGSGGSGSNFTSPQRPSIATTVTAGGKGFDSWGLPVTPVAATLAQQDYCTPRPAGVLERVKYHLRGGASGASQQAQQHYGNGPPYSGAAAVAAVDAL